MHIQLIYAVSHNVSNDLPIAQYLQRILSPDTRLSFAHLPDGLPSIERDSHAAFNKPAIIQAALAAQKSGCDGIFINCFDDPGVYECRELLNIPVYGGYIPTMVTLLSLADHIGVITTDNLGILSEERKARLLGLERHVKAILPIDISVLEFHQNAQRLVQRAADICCRMRSEHQITAVTLGCTGMYFIADDLRAELARRNCNIVLIEPLCCGIRYVEYVISLGFTNALPIQNKNNLIKFG